MSFAPPLKGSFHEGQVVPIKITVRAKATRALVNPTDINFRITSPDGIVNDDIDDANADVTNISTGVWQLDYTVPSYHPGIWHVRIEVSGNGTDNVVETTFWSPETEFA